MAEAITPVVSDFFWAETPAGTVLRSATLEAVASHLFTTRDLAFRGGAVDPDYARLGAAFGVHEDQVVRVRQVHATAVLDVRPGTDSGALADADAIISTDPGRVIGVRVADCVPVLIADRQHRVVAAVHAGWRGTAAGIVTKTVKRLHELGVPSADLVAVIGPSIGPCCYQVDVVVKEAFDAAQDHSDRWFTPDGHDRWRLDLWRATVDQLTEAGVASPSVHVARLCTADHPDRFYSFRRDRADGRMIAAIRVAGADR